jgi:hypothetical protein
MYPLEMSVYSVVVVVRWKCAESLFFGDSTFPSAAGRGKISFFLLGITAEKPTFHYQSVSVSENLVFRQLPESLVRDANYSVKCSAFHAR